MKQEIRERIEKIQKGEVPEGYRKTKVGIIPIEWNVEKIGALTSSASGTTPIREKQRIYYNDGSHLWVKTTDLNNKLIKDTSEKVTQRALDETACKLLPKNTILVAMYGGFNQIGRTGLLTKEAACNQALTGVSPNDGFDSRYLQEVLNLRTFYWKKFAASSRKDPNITRNDVMQFPVPHSNKTEEIKIVEILSTWDKAIELKEELIEEKKEFKKGLMQNLLTGEIRFPEFTGDWEEKKLGDIFSERKEINQNGSELLFITSSRGVIKRSEIEGKDNSSKDKSKYKKICRGDIGYNTMRMWQGVSAVSEYEGIVSPAYTVVKLKEDGDIYYFGYLFKLRKIIDFFWRYSQGLVNDTLNLKYENFKIIKITVPTYKVEQEKISATLKSIDTEISLIKAEKELLEKQKRGLMQLLLTGIVRVNT